MDSLHPSYNPRQWRERAPVLAAAVTLLLRLGLAHAPALDLHDAVVVVPRSLSGPERQAVLMLIEEVEKRTRIRWLQTNRWPAGQASIIAIGPRSASNEFAGHDVEKLTPAPTANQAEGYEISVQTGQGSSAVFIIGNDSRGVLFGAGRLLRELRMQTGRISLRDDFHVATAPKYPLRGHQLGYRPK